MSKAAKIVNKLLEADEPDDSPEQFLAHHIDQSEQDDRAGKLTYQSALTAHDFWHRTATYKDGIRPIEVRRNGRTKTWVTRPGEFRIPVKYGFRECFYITQNEADAWSTIPLPNKPKPEKIKKPVVNPSSLMPPLL